MSDRKAVLVTTQYRGVFFGYLENGAEAESPAKLTLQDARNCIYWSADAKGFIGLSVAGPGSSCRIGPRVAQLTLYGITSISPVTDEAARRWEEAPWK